MSYMSELDRFIKDIISNYKASGLPITMAIADIAREFNLSYSQAEYEVEKLMSNPTDGGMTFQDQYTKKRFEGK